MMHNPPRWLWIFCAAAGSVLVGIVDYASGYELSFSTFYFLPVSLAAWFAGRDAALAIALFSAIIWFTSDFLAGHTYVSHFHAVWNTMMRFVSFSIIGWSIAIIRNLIDQERRTTAELRRLISEVKVLEAFLPICCVCKKIRNDDGEWLQMERYIGEQTGTRFSHGYCPECAKKAMAEAGIPTD